MKNNKKIGLIGILGHDEIEKVASELEKSKNAYEVNQENAEWFPVFEKRNNAMKRTQQQNKELELILNFLS